MRPRLTHTLKHSLAARENNARAQGETQGEERPEKQGRAAQTKLQRSRRLYDRIARARGRRVLLPAHSYHTNHERTGTTSDRRRRVEEHHHVLQYYAREVAKNTLPVDSKATILHLDSHADMGVPRAYLEADEHMERFSAINDFMITAALTGIAEHLVFVEPPWSNQFVMLCLRRVCYLPIHVGRNENMCGSRARWLEDWATSSGATVNPEQPQEMI